MLGYLYKEDSTRESKIEHKHYFLFEDIKLPARSSDNNSLGWGVICFWFPCPLGG